MKRYAHTRVLTIALTLFMALGACAQATAPAETEQSAEEAADTTVGYVLEPSQYTLIGNNTFSLKYSSDDSLNPITGDNADNLLIAQLMYEGLFTLDNTFAPHPVLCESAVTEDNLTYTVTIKPNVAMSDETTLTASDVAYTLNNARERGRFVSRLSGVDSVDATDELTVVITLKSPNAHFTRLLDVPIIKSGTIDYRVPPGTGPYTFSGGDAPYLSRLSSRRDYAKLPVSTIYLTEFPGQELIERFSEGLIDLVWDDPTDTVAFEASRQHDVRAFNTTTLMFVGFNTRKEALRVPELRRAIGIAADRQYITGEIMNGLALPSQLAFSPAYPGYSTSWEHPEGDILQAVSELIAAVGLADFDNDSYLEFPSADYGYVPFSIDFIVYAGNTYKTRTAAHIAESLTRVGFDITVRELNWDEYIGALENGDFDMYLGEVTLSSDFDLSPLLLPGGRLNYGGTGDEMYVPYLDEYFTADTTATAAIAVNKLCDQIYTNAPFVPISYKKNMLHSYRGVISDAAPSQSSVFFGLTEWTITLNAGR